MKRHPISPRLTVQEASILARACGDCGCVVYGAEGQPKTPDGIAADRLVRIGLIVLRPRLDDSAVRLIAATALGRWRLRGGNPPHQRRAAET